MRASLATVLLLLLAAAMSGCGQSPTVLAATDAAPKDQIPAGAVCLVQLQRNALGAGSSTPISATRTQINDAVLALEGTMVRMNSDWVVLKLADKSECWIAKSAVLTITIRADARSQ